MAAVVVVHPQFGQKHPQQDEQMDQVIGLLGGIPLEQIWTLWGGRYHVEPALPVFEGLLVQAQEHPSSNLVQANPGPVPRVLRFEEVEEHVHGGVVPEVIACLLYTSPSPRD